MMTPPTVVRDSAASSTVERFKPVPIAPPPQTRTPRIRTHRPKTNQRDKDDADGFSYLGFADEAGADHVGLVDRVLACRDAVVEVLCRTKKRKSAAVRSQAEGGAAVAAPRRTAASTPFSNGICLVASSIQAWFVCDTLSYLSSNSKVVSQLWILRSTSRRRRLSQSNGKKQELETRRLAFR